MTFIEEDADLVKENWLEAARDNFGQALAEGNIDLAKAIIKDVKDKGFDTTTFEEELKEHEITIE